MATYSRAGGVQPPGDVPRPSTWERPPGWLLLPPSSPPSPPVETRVGLLPVEALSWEDFERLCLRLLELEAETVHVHVKDRVGATAPVTRGYGSRGQKQLGIDIYSAGFRWCLAKPLTSAAMWPCKRGE